MHSFTLLFVFCLIVCIKTQDIPGEYLVKFKRSFARATMEDVNTIATNVEGIVKRRFRRALRGGFAIKNLKPKQLEKLRNHPRVEYVVPNTIVNMVGSETITSYTQHLDRDDQRILPLDGFYNYTQDGTGVNAYIIDSGVRPTHIDFGGRAVSVYDATGGDGIDCNGHGTHVSGTVGGFTYGIAKNVNVKSVRVFVCTGGSASDVVIDGIDWVTANHVQPAVINLSLGGDPNLAIDDAVNDAIDAGIPCAVAAGNDHVDASTKSPSRVARAVTVGATEIMTDTIASFSNFGSSVDVFAPGVDIYSLWYGNDNYIITASGTSQATPQVAGLLALYRQCNPNLTPAQLSALVIADSTKNVVVFTEGTTSPNRLIYTGNVCSTLAPTPTPSMIPTTTATPTTKIPTITVRPTTRAPTTTARLTTRAPTTTARLTTRVPTTTARPTTAPTTTARPTTRAPTTTARPTTRAPTTTARLTTARPTTRAPTTTAKPTTKAPTCRVVATPPSSVTVGTTGVCPGAPYLTLTTAPYQVTLPSGYRFDYAYVKRGSVCYLVTLNGNQACYYLTHPKAQLYKLFASGTATCSGTISRVSFYATQC